MKSLPSCTGIRKHCSVWDSLPLGSAILRCSDASATVIVGTMDYEDSNHPTKAYLDFFSLI